MAHPHPAEVNVHTEKGRYAGFYRKNGVVEPLPGDAASVRAALADKDAVVWIDLLIVEPEDASLLSEVFEFHPLAIEDSISPRVDPAKVDDYGGYVFIVVQALTPYTEDRELEAIEVDFYLGPNFVVSCHREPVPSIEMYLERRERREQLMRRGPDWIVHGLLDTMVDDYLPIVDALDETIDEIEARVLERAEHGQLQRILLARRNSLRLRRATAPQRDIMNRLSRNEFPKLISPESAIYFRDVYDHLVRIEYLVEAVRDLSDGALQTYLSVVSNRLNEIMKVLTAAATVFLPLTVITGIYGMNFEDNVFPGFDSSWGFWAVIGIMLLNSALMLAYFRNRRWV
jgi:magnesium transporter